MLRSAFSAALVPSPVTAIVEEEYPIPGFSTITATICPPSITGSNFASDFAVRNDNSAAAVPARPASVIAIAGAAE